MDEADEVIARLQRSAAAAQKVLDATSGGAEGSARIEGGRAYGEPGFQWVVRYTWAVINGLPHPEHTFANHATESKAIDAGSFMLLNFDNSGDLRLTAVHVRGPGRSWVRVE